MFALVSAPADANANSFPPFPCIPPPPVVSEGEHVPFPEHISCFGPHYFPTLANAHARSPPHFHTHAMPPSIVRRMDRGHVLLSDGWVARAPAPISAPLRPSPSQLAAQRPRRQRRRGHAPARRVGTSCDVLVASAEEERRQHYLLSGNQVWGAVHHVTFVTTKRPRCATPPPGVPTPDSPATPDFIAHDDYALSHRLACVRDQRLSHRAQPSLAAPCRD